MRILNYICTPDKLGSKLFARVAKLVDALCSGRSVGNHVLVRIQSRAQRPFRSKREGFFIYTKANYFIKAGK
jgi:hypothetical protein